MDISNPQYSHRNSQKDLSNRRSNEGTQPYKPASFNDNAEMQLTEED
jgi:hypothetical protein